MQQIPREGALVGIDYGKKRIGTAICNREQSLAVPLETVPFCPPGPLAKKFRVLAADHLVRGWILGLPLFKSGDESPLSKEVRQFGGWLAGETGLPVDFFDERHTSQLAELNLWEAGGDPRLQKDRVDRLAAQLILQGYLDSVRNHND